MINLESKKEELATIRDIVVDWYERKCLDDEIESFDYDLTRYQDRLKIFILGIFFNCVFQEKKALRIFEEMESTGCLQFSELDDFELNLKETIRRLKWKTGRSHGILKMQDLIDSVHTTKRLFSREGDIISIFHDNQEPEDFIQFLYEKLSGVKAKLFWICREYRKLFDIPNEYCYVPDSHVTKFLYNMRFLKRKVFSLDECLEISRNMSEYLGNEYFDLPFMRYHQVKCKDEKGCTCQIKTCRFNVTTSDRLEDWMKKR